MVRLFRGGRGGRGVPRPPFSFPRHMRPPRDFEPEFIHPYGAPRGRLLRGNIRPGPPHPRLPPPLSPRMGPSPLPPPPPRPLHRPPHQPPLNHRELHMSGPIPRRPHPMNRPGIPPPMHSRPLGPPPLTRPLRPGPPFLRGRGGPARRGVGVKRLGTTTNGRNKKPPKRKEKKEGDFYCETCDRSWQTLEKLEEHLSQHQVCGRDGCTFTGHPKVVQKHVELQHDTGLYQRIKADNPDDVAKWIAERKSRFPTKENVQKKQAQQDEMMNRGERIPSQGKRFQNRPSWSNRGRNVNQNANNSRRGGGGGGPRQPRPPLISSDSSKWRDPDAWRGDLPKFPGTAAFSEEDKKKDLKENGTFSDDEDWSVKTVERPNTSNGGTPFVSNILTSLMANYGSDMSEEDDNGNNQGSSMMENANSVKDINEKTELTRSQEGDDCVPRLKSEGEEITPQAHQIGEDSDSGPEESTIDREDKSNIPLPNTSEKECKAQLDNTQNIETNKSNSRPKPPQTRPVMRKHQLSLLEKLLCNEIRKERNAILQCVRYVVNNNFLGCGDLQKSAVDH